MKATKLIAVAIILGIASLGFAQQEGPTDQAPDRPNAVVITLKKALHFPYMVKAMHEQLNPSFLQVDKESYTAPVRIKNEVFYVTGTQAEWKVFFREVNDGKSVDAAGKLIPLSKARKDARLAKAMRVQLSPNMLNQEKELYIASVRYNHYIVYVSGTYEQWKDFFNCRPYADPER